MINIMPSAPDYSLYIGVKKIRVAQTANANISVIKNRVPNIYDGYFPMYRSVRLPVNALLSNKFTQDLGGSGAPPEFSPINIPTMSLWLDAGDTSSMTFSGLNITTWADKSGNLHTATATGTGIQLGLSPAGKQALVMPGSLSFTLANAITISGTSVSIFIQASSTGTMKGLMEMYGNARIIAANFYYDGSNVYFLTPYSWDNTNASISVIEDSAANKLNVYFNGNIPNITSTGYVAATPNSNIRIGARSSDPTQMWVGTIQEVLFYNRALLIGERQRIEGYLAWKWGTQASLPASHPFKLAKP